MGKSVHVMCTSDLNVPIFNAFHEGRVVLVNKKLRKRVLCVGSKGGLFVKMGNAADPSKKVYISQMSKIVLTNDVRK